MEGENDEFLYDEDSPEETKFAYSISCSNMPDTLLHATTAKDHFQKFGPVSQIVLKPKKMECIVDYELQSSAEKAVLNAGAYDGRMFDVRWFKPKRNKSKANEDPDWVPDPELESELEAMNNQSYKLRLQRQQKMDIDKAPIAKKPIKKTVPKEIKKKPIINKQISGKKQSESPQPVVAQKSKPLEKDEIRELLTKSWSTFDDKLKALDMRDKIIRSRLIIRKGAIKGCCPDMCSERERILRHCQRQTSFYEADPETGILNPCYAIKQYSRSSADQEEPLPHELRPVPVLKRTLVYLLEHIVDACDQPDVELGDWFHFLWDRLRAIRKDITQQALCCSESVRIVEACARFHAHCAARLVEEPPSSFDQRLNTENLLKCLQTLKYMYGDLRTRNEIASCINEPEFRAYVILLNMKDSNFMWEVQQLDPEVQSSPEIRFAIKVFTALDNKNYIKFFKLVKETSYLNACILLRYFNDIRLQALVRMIKSYSPRGVSQFPADDFLDMLAFESMDSMSFYLDHYGLQMINIKDISHVLLDRNSFYENESPYAPERAINLVESKRTLRLGEIIFGSKLPEIEDHLPHNSFAPNNHLKRSAILAEDQGYVPAKETIDEINAIIDNMNIRPIKAPASSAPIEKVQPVKSFTFVAPMTVPVSQTPSAPSRTSNPFIATSVFNKTQPKIDTNSTNSSPQFTFSDPTKIQPFIKPEINVFDRFSKSGENKEPSTVNAGSKINPMEVFGKGANNIFKPEPKDVFGKSPSEIFSSAIPKSNAFNVNTVTPSSIFAGSLFNQNPLSANQPTASNMPLFSNNFTNSTTTAIDYNFIAKQKEEEKEKQRLEQEARAIALKKEEEKRHQELLEKKKREEELARKIEQEKAEQLAREKKLLEQKELERLRLEQKELETKRLKQIELEKRQLEFELKVENESKELVPQLLDEVVQEHCIFEIKENIKRINRIKESASEALIDLVEDISYETCQYEINIAMRLKEIGLRFQLRSCIFKWKNAVEKIKRKRTLLFSTPSWLSKYNIIEPPSSQVDALQRMKLFHRGALPSLKIPSPKIKRKVFLFDLIKKPLLQKSQEIRSSSDIFWKITLSAPSSNECQNIFLFFKKWFQNTFAHEKDMSKKDYSVYLKEHFWHKKISLSLCSIFDTCDKSPEHSIDGSNGFIFYATGETQNISFLNQRIESALTSSKICTPLPIAIILLSSKNKCFYEHQLNLSAYKRNCKISEYIFLFPESCNDESIVSVTKKALYWLARRNTGYPSIECNLLGQFLDQCIGGELWYRFNISKNSSIRQAFENLPTLVDLYNMAVEKTITLLKHNDLVKCPSFPEEFKQFLIRDSIYPKEFSFTDNNWKENNEKICSALQSFKLPQYKSQQNISDVKEFQSDVEQYVNKTGWFSESDQILDKIFTVVKSPLTKIPWMDILNVIIVEKISKFVQNSNTNCPLIATYRKEHLHNYRTSPWWYKSSIIRNVDHIVENFPLDEVDASLRKRPRLESSNEMPDESWINSIFTNLNDSIDNVSKCQKLISNLNESLDLETKKQQQLENILKCALEDG